MSRAPPQVPAEGVNPEMKAASWGVGPGCACMVGDFNRRRANDILRRKGYQMATHFKFLIVKAPDIMGQMGLEAPRGVGPRGVSSSAVSSVECVGQYHFGSASSSVRISVKGGEGQCNCEPHKTIKKGSPENLGLDRMESMA